jgi:hypothetical protein
MSIRTEKEKNCQKYFIEELRKNNVNRGCYVNGVNSKSLLINSNVDGWRIQHLSKVIL